MQLSTAPVCNALGVLTNQCYRTWWLPWDEADSDVACLSAFQYALGFFRRPPLVCSCPILINNVMLPGDANTNVLYYNVCYIHIKPWTLGAVGSVATPIAWRQLLLHARSITELGMCSAAPLVLQHAEVSVPTKGRCCDLLCSAMRDHSSRLQACRITRCRFSLCFQQASLETDPVASTSEMLNSSLISRTAAHYAMNTHCWTKTCKLTSRMHPKTAGRLIQNMA